MDNDRGAKMTNDYSFTMDDDTPMTRLVVLGIGGMGNNAMENLARCGVPGLELYSLNTDVQALRRCVGSKPVQLGAKRTGGKGAGGNSDIGRLSAEDDSEKVRKLVKGAEMVFIASGMGGGTGSGAAPVIAGICRELGILTVCVATMPMACEGPRREEKGRIGLAGLRKTVDSLLIIENEKLSAVMDQEDVSIIEVFRKADKVVVDSVGAIAGIIHSHGYINLDLADLKNVLQRGGAGDCVDAYIGLGEATGPDRARKASEIALSNPLLRTIDIKGAANLLVNVAGSEQIGHKEAMSAVENIVARVGCDNREIFMGVVTDNSLGDTICVTVVATGLPCRPTAVVKMTPVEDAAPKTFSKLGRENLLIDDIRINSSAAAVNGLSDSGPDLAGAADYSLDISGFSPLIKKDEWQIPAYIRCKVKSPDSDQLLESRVRKISTRTKAADRQYLQPADRNQFQEPLYHMAG